jgi:hypothetical protein
MAVTKASKCISLLFILFALIGCRAATSRLAEASEIPAALSAVGNDLESQGYQAMKCVTVRPTPWEANKFRLRNKQVTSFKGKRTFT